MGYPLGTPLAVFGAITTLAIDDRASVETSTIEVTSNVVGTLVEFFR